MDVVDNAIALARFTAIEAALDLDPFDREAQKDFENMLEKSLDLLKIEC